MAASALDRLLCYREDASAMRRLIKIIDARWAAHLRIHDEHGAQAMRELRETLGTAVAAIERILTGLGITCERPEENDRG